MSLLGSMVLSVLAIQAQPDTNRQILPGRLIPKVICEDPTEQTYAVYLPKRYTPTKAWPVLFCFDPAARGSLPVSKFETAAEAFGYILIGSNNSRNYVRNAAFDAINAMWKDANRRFSIDSRRVYLAGFSGGARASCNIANINRSVQGVIACGAGFGAYYPPDPTRGFAFYGIVGNADQNYLELMRLDQSLDRLPHDHRVKVFEGGHVWPPDDRLFEAVAWLELQAMRDGLCSKRPEEIDRQFSLALDRAEKLEQEGHWDRALLDYQAMLDDFDRLLDLELVKAKVRRLEDDARVKSALKARKKRQQREDRAIGEFRQRFSRLHRMPLKTSWIQREKAWWADRAETLSRTAEDDTDESNRLMARRLMTLIKATAYEETMLTLSQNDHDRAILAGEVAVTLNPENPVIHYNLGCAYAKKGQADPAIASLQIAVALGFDDAAFMAGDSDLKSLRGDARFEHLLDTMK